MSSNKGKIVVESTAKGKQNPYKNDVIYSPEGQWKYPGQITKVPSSDITMKGVNYPVKGVDDLGHTQMMYPDGEYTFPGQNVTEYPQLAMGGPSPGKAEEMLHDGTAHGKALTEAQKRYFGMIAHSKKHGGTNFHKSHSPFDYSERSRIQEATMAYGGPTNINLMKNTFSRQTGGVPDTYDVATANLKSPGMKYNPQDSANWAAQFHKKYQTNKYNFEIDHTGENVYRVNKNNPNTRIPINMDDLNDFQKMLIIHQPGTIDNRRSGRGTASGQLVQHNWGGSNAANRGNHLDTIPSMMARYGGYPMYPLGGSPAFGEGMAQSSSTPQYNTSQMEAAGYTRVPGYTETGDPYKGEWVDPTTGQSRFIKQGEQLSGMTPPATTSNINKGRTPTPGYKAPGTTPKPLGYTVNTMGSPAAHTNYLGVRPARSQQNIFQKIKYGAQDALGIQTKATGGPSASLTHWANPYLRVDSDHPRGIEEQVLKSPSDDPFEDKKNNFINWLQTHSMAALHEEMIPHAIFHHMPNGNIVSHAELTQGEENQMKKGGSKNWLKGAINPKHVGYCTPMTKSTCTPRRKAFAMTMKKHHGFHKEEGGAMNEDQYFYNPGGYAQQGGFYNPDMAYPYGGDISIPDLHQPWDPMMQLGGDFNDDGSSNYMSTEDAHVNPNMEFLSSIDEMRRGGSRHDRSHAISGLTNYCGGPVTEVCITAALNDSDPNIRMHAAHIKDIRGVHYAHGGEKRWEQTALMEWQSGGGMNSGSPQDWGFNPANANVNNYLNAYTSAKSTNDPSKAFGNFGNAMATAEAGKNPYYTATPSAQRGGAPWSYYQGNTTETPINSQFGTYGAYGPHGLENWLPINRMQGHWPDEFLPATSHPGRRGQTEHLKLDPGSYLAGADLSYGWLDKSAPKRIALHFNKPSGSSPEVTSRMMPSKPEAGAPRRDDPYFNQKEISPETKQHMLQMLRDSNSGPNDQFGPRPGAGPVATPEEEKYSDFRGVLSGQKRYGGVREYQYGAPIDGLTPGTGYPTDPFGINGPTSNQAPGASNVPQYMMDQNKGTSALDYVPGQTVNLNRHSGYNKEDLANWGIAGIDTVTSMLNQKDVLKKESDLRNRTHADMVFNSTPQNARSRGDYDTNTGAFRPDQMVPTQYQGQPGMRKMGGSSHCNCGGFQEGGSYYLDQHEIDKILAEGGEIEYED